MGFVHEKDKNEPIAGRDRSRTAITPSLSPLATGPDGKFGDDVPPASTPSTSRQRGTSPAPATWRSRRRRANVNVDCPLDALPRVGTVVGHVRDADTNQPLGGIQVVLDDSQRKELRLTTDPSGGFRFEGVSPGTAQVSVTADGYLVLVEPVDVKARQDNTIDLLLRPKPKTANVKVTANEITIRQQIQFALDSAVILPESFGLLTEIADTIIRHPEIKRVEVQGHTDNSGTPEHNKTLSEQRAEAVRAWLVQHGVPADRLVAKGYGQEKPLVPNVTAGNRAQNRRVQFIILDKEGSAPPGQAPPPPPANARRTPPGLLGRFATPFCRGPKGPLFARSRQATRRPEPVARSSRSLSAYPQRDSATDFLSVEELDRSPCPG